MATTTIQIAHTGITTESKMSVFMVSRVCTFALVWDELLRDGNPATADPMEVVTEDGFCAVDETLASEDEKLVVFGDVLSSVLL